VKFRVQTYLKISSTPPFGPQQVYLKDSTGSHINYRPKPVLAHTAQWVNLFLDLHGIGIKLLKDCALSPCRKRQDMTLFPVKPFLGNRNLNLLLPVKKDSIKSNMFWDIQNEFNRLNGETTSRAERVMKMVNLRINMGK